MLQSLVRLKILNLRSNLLSVEIGLEWNGYMGLNASPLYVACIYIYHMCRMLTTDLGSDTYK